jgi:hypothetical protein
MPELLNHTPFAASSFATFDKHAHQFEVVIISATFEARPGRPVHLAGEQAPVREVDEYWGEPGVSSVRYEGEIALGKPFVDILVNGRALAPAGRKVERMMVGVSVGGLRKELHITGDRYWRPGPLGKVPSAPKPFESIPIVYERAFGGTDTRAPDASQHFADPRNPLGVGFKGAPAQNAQIETQLPNVEYPSQLVRSAEDRPEPAGLGVVGRNTVPRITFAGTYDETWMNDQRPLLPIDFDPRHYQCVPADQQSDATRGGERVEVRNMTPEGLWQFTLPTLDVPLRLFPGGLSEAPLRLDTVLLEPDAYRVTLIARTKILILRNQAPLEEVILGHVTSAWWRARLTGKKYVDFRGAGERSPGIEAFRL